MKCRKCERDIVVEPCPYCNPIISAYDMRSYEQCRVDGCFDNGGLVQFFSDVVELWKQKVIPNPLFHELASRAMAILKSIYKE